MNAVPAVFHEQRSVVLHQARHPLLDPKKVVPVDITLGTSFDTLVVTGPNTGGKNGDAENTGALLFDGAGRTAYTGTRRFGALCI